MCVPRETSSSVRQVRPNSRAASALAYARYSIKAVQYPYSAVTSNTGVLMNPPDSVILNHVFGGRRTMRGASACIEVLERTDGLPAETRRKLRVDEPAHILADILINAAFTAADGQALVIAMVSPDHIVGNCRAIIEGSRFAATELALLNNALRLSRRA